MISSTKQKVKAASLVLMFAVAFGMAFPSQASAAATSACDNIKVGGVRLNQVNKGSWGCIAANNINGVLRVYTYDVDGDGHCVILKTRQLFGGSSSTWNGNSWNCSGHGYLYTFSGSAGVSTNADARIYRSDYGRYATLYNIY